MPYDFAEKLFDKTWIGMRVIISPNDAAPVEISHPALFVPNAEAVAAAPARAETLAREAAEAANMAEEAKKSAATAAREAASLTASLRKLEWLKPRADAELAFADKATTSSAPFSRAIGTRNLPIRVRAPANTINRRNSAGGKRGTPPGPLGWGSGQDQNETLAIFESNRSVGSLFPSVIRRDYEHGSAERGCMPSNPNVFS